MDATKKEPFKKKQKETGVSRRKEKWIVAAKSTIDSPSIGAREKGTLPKIPQPSKKIDEGPDYPISIKEEHFLANLNEGKEDNSYLTHATTKSIGFHEAKHDTDEATGEEIKVDPQNIFAAEFKCKIEIVDNTIELVGNIKDETPLKAFETKDFKENEMENYVGSYTTDGKVWSLSFA